MTESNGAKPDISPIWAGWTMVPVLFVFSFTSSHYNRYSHWNRLKQIENPEGKIEYLFGGDHFYFQNFRCLTKMQKRSFESNLEKQNGKPKYKIIQTPISIMYEEYIKFSYLFRLTTVRNVHLLWTATIISRIVNIPYWSFYWNFNFSLFLIGPKCDQIY